MQGLAHQRFALVPDRWAGRAEHLVERHALAELLGHVGQCTQFASQRPEDHWRLDPLAAQALKHAQGMSRLAVEHRVGQAEYIETRTVGHCSLYGFDGDLAFFGHQFELFDFLRSGQQVAFNPCCDQFDSILCGGKPCLRQTLANPLWQLADVHRPDLHELGVRTVNQCLAPFGLLRTAIQLGQADQQQGVFGRSGAVFH